MFYNNLVILMCFSNVMMVKPAPLLLYQLPLDNSLIQIQQQMQELQLLQQLSLASRFQQPADLMIFPTNTQEGHIDLPDTVKTNQNKKPDKNFLNPFFTQSLESNSGEDDSEVIDASPLPEETSPPRVLVMLPQGKFSVGSIIQAIPWLPYEINVPDTIIWAWNGISSIISGIRQRLPLRRPQFRIPQDEVLKMITKQNNLRESIGALQMPVPMLVMPIPYDLNGFNFGRLMSNQPSQI